MSAPTAHPETSTTSSPQREPLFHVILLDDDQHTYDYVVEMLGALFFMPPGVAFDHALEVDKTGRTIVITCERAQAEFGRDQILSYGKDPRMANSRGSMRAVIEQVYAGPS
jgi:ATP-dependent Clp protease adaptor protein ClpS